MEVVTELVKGKMENNIRGALVRLSNNSLLKRPVNKLYPIEYVRSKTRTSGHWEFDIIKTRS